MKKLATILSVAFLAFMPMKAKALELKSLEIGTETFFYDNFTADKSITQPKEEWTGWKQGINLNLGLNGVKLENNLNAGVTNYDSRKLQVSMYRSAGPYCD